MTALANATVEQVSTLAGLTEVLVEVDRTLNGLLAVKEGVLALGSRLALDMAGDDDDHGDLSLRAVAAEFAAALRVSDRTVQARMAEAEVKVTRFPGVWRAQGEGRIGAGHARAILDAGMHLDDEVSREAYVEKVVAFAETESPNRVGRMARRVAECFQPRTLDDRHREARRERRVWVTDAADGMARLGLLGPAALVHGVFSRLTAMAEKVQVDGAPERADAAGSVHDRRIDEVRCDLALDLLLSGAPSGHETAEGMLAAIAGRVSVTVPVLTLMGVDETPAELDGAVPVDAATARRLAGAASGWDRILTHPLTGGVLAVDRYRPSADLIRHLTARDQRCRFPGCGRAAVDCDLDHTTDAALGGPTTAENLGDVCRRHHVLKHHSPWRVEQLGGGLFAWTSPTGKVYIDRPPAQNTVTFTEEDPPPF
ncbi:MAG: DUF222 domain-containing protein [Microbacterium sp.]|nr:DUF222 domain-containing protein [Microbacterium sp.]